MLPGFPLGQPPERTLALAGPRPRSSAPWSCSSTHPPIPLSVSASAPETAAWDSASDPVPLRTQVLVGSEGQAPASLCLVRLKRPESAGDLLATRESQSKRRHFRGRLGGGDGVPAVAVTARPRTWALYAHSQPLSVG